MTCTSISEFFRRRRLQLAICNWATSLLFALTSWGLSIWINRSCAFVRVTNSDDGSVLDRGIQRGQLLPLDECIGWGNYEDLTLDSNMIAARTSSALSVVVGALFVIILGVYMFVGRPCVRRTCKWLACAMALANVVLQALTHLMSRSNLCQQEEGSTGSESSSCDKVTPTYRATYATIVLWTASTVLSALLPVDKVVSTDESEHPLDIKNDSLDLGHLEDD